MRMDAAAEATVALVADMMRPDSIDRLPEHRHCEIEETIIPWVALAPFETSAIPKLRLALAAALEPYRLQP